jgi:hypothetical protein
MNKMISQLVITVVLLETQLCGPSGCRRLGVKVVNFRGSTVFSYPVNSNGVSWFNDKFASIPHRAAKLNPNSNNTYHKLPYASKGFSPYFV